MPTVVRLRIPFRAVLLSVMWVGCGELGLETVPGLDADTGSWGPGEGPSGQGDAPASCTREGFSVRVDQATQDRSEPELPWFQYQARNVETQPFDELQITSYQAAPWYGPSTPGLYALDGSNYSDCGLCVLLVTACTGGYQCEQVHFADQGELEITDFGERSGQFQARLRNVVLREVDIDPHTFWSTPVPDGTTWCLDDLELAVETKREH